MFYVLLATVIVEWPQYDSYNGSQHQKHVHTKSQWFSNSEYNVIYSLKPVILLSLSLNNTEYQYQLTLQKMLNKSMHSKFGNRRIMKPKTHYKILQINTGNGAFSSSRDRLKQTVEENIPDLVIISESNMERSEPNLNLDFEGYYFENNFMSHMNTSRITVMIKSGISYERIKSLEENDLSTIVIKIKLNNKKIFICLWCLPPVGSSICNAED